MPRYDSVDAAILMQGMTSKQKGQFHCEMADTWKDPKTGARLKGWFGIIGAHHFYLGDYSRGLKYLLFFWTGVPVWLSLFDRGIKKRTEQVNRRAARGIAARIRRATLVANQAPDLAYEHGSNFS